MKLRTSNLEPIPHLYTVIMAGGSGTRFWPLSRQARPKQLLALEGKQTLLQAAVVRLGDPPALARVAEVLLGQRLQVIAGAGEDEIGTLVGAFNRMTADLKTSRSSAQSFEDATDESSPAQQPTEQDVKT